MVKENNARATLQISSEITGFKATNLINTKNYTLKCNLQIGDTCYSPPKTSVFTILQLQALKNTLISYYTIHQQSVGKM
jgi:hypothetical protein